LILQHVPSQETMDSKNNRVVMLRVRIIGDFKQGLVG